MPPKSFCGKTALNAMTGSYVTGLRDDGGGMGCRQGCTMVEGKLRQVLDILKTRVLARCRRNRVWGLFTKSAAVIY
jgi:hypothetical protein